MFNLSTTEVLIILVVALLVLGPEQLPKVASKLGKGLRDLQRAANDFKREVTDSVREVERSAQLTEIVRSKPTPPPSAAQVGGNASVVASSSSDPYAAIAAAASARSTTVQVDPVVPPDVELEGYPPEEGDLADVPNPHAAPRPVPSSPIPVSESASTTRSFANSSDWAPPVVASDRDASPIAPFVPLRRIQPARDSVAWSPEPPPEPATELPLEASPEPLALVGGALPLPDPRSAI